MIDTRASTCSLGTIALLLGIIMLAGCARVGSTETTGGRAQSSRVSVFSAEWTYRLMPNIEEYRNRANPIQGSVPIVDAAGNRVFVGSADNNVYCLRADTGEVIWRLDVGAAVRSQPLFMHDTQVVFFGTDDGELWAVGAAEGDRRWVFEAEGEIIHRAVLRDEALYFTSAANTVHALDWTDGQEIWRYQQERSISEFEVSGYAGVAVSERAVYTGFSDGTVAAFDAYDGNIIWDRDLSEDIASRGQVGGIPVMRDVDTTPVLGKRRVYIASYEAGVYALDRETGMVAWREPVKGVVELSGNGTTLFAAQAGEGVIAIDTSDGEVLWRQNLGQATYFRPRVYHDLLIVPDSQRGLTALRMTDGSLVQRYPVGGGAGGDVELVGATAFVVTNGGVLAALTLR